MNTITCMFTNTHTHTHTGACFMCNLSYLSMSVRLPFLLFVSTRCRFTGLLSNSKPSGHLVTGDLLNHTPRERKKEKEQNVILCIFFFFFFLHSSFHTLRSLRHWLLTTSVNQMYQLPCNGHLKSPFNGLLLLPLFSLPLLHMVNCLMHAACILSLSLSGWVTASPDSTVLSDQDNRMALCHPPAGYIFTSLQSMYATVYALSSVGDCINKMRWEQSSE